MNPYLIEADAPLVFRSGKPFGNGSRDGARYPWPSAVAGALRTARLRANPETEPSSLLSLTVQGPLLIRQQAGQSHLMVPAPQDAVALLPEGGKTAHIYRLRPGTWPDGCGANLPQGLQPVLLEESAPVGKAQTMAKFWTLQDLLTWDADSQQVTAAMLAAHSPLDSPEERTHVAIDSDTLAAQQGKLFQIQSLNFGARRTRDGFDRTRWALGVRTPEAFTDQTLTLGGERRTARLLKCRALAEALALPTKHATALAGTRALAMTLLTPAVWKTGSLPDWIDEASLEGEHPAVPGLRLKLRAMACARPEVISGWDLARQAPKPAYRVVPAGSTLWFEIMASPDAESWPEQLWLASLCSGQWAKDGWGLGLPRITELS